MIKHTQWYGGRSFVPCVQITEIEPGQSARDKNHRVHRVYHHMTVNTYSVDIYRRLECSGLVAGATVNNYYYRLDKGHCSTCRRTTNSARRRISAVQTWHMHMHMQTCTSKSRQVSQLS